LLQYFPSIEKSCGAEPRATPQKAASAMAQPNRR
jgi:hypothetical protein